MSNRIIENVELVEVRPQDGAQRYQWGPDVVKDTLWLTGITTASGVKQGDRGKLVYRSTQSQGLYFFYPYEKH